MKERHLFADEWLVRAASTLPGVTEHLEGWRAEKRPRLFDAIVQTGVADADAVFGVVSSMHHIERLTAEIVDRPAMTVVPEKLCRRYRLVPFKLHDESIEVAMENPLDMEAHADLQAITGRMPIAYYALPEQFDMLFSQAYSPDLIVNDLVDRLAVDSALEVLEEEKSPDHAQEVKGPMEELVASIIVKAFQMRASDIHLEHEARASVVRYRVDGMLKNILTLPLFVGAGALVSRIKIMANLDIADRLRPQDGRAKLRIAGTELGLRVSTLPTNFGEKVVIRLLDKRSAEVPFSKLGIRPDLAEKLTRALGLAQGVILVTGPTGSGKTTTLYSCLNLLKAEHTNIVTVEDPVEYKLNGINQTQVQEKQGLTFAAVLRSVLRQDPDVILVGEIRDKETADVAMQAALTGHLVISSLHTNDALSTISRLVDMGVERFKLAPGLIAITAQRLVRTLCPACRVPAAEVDAALAAAQRVRGLEVKQWLPKGCAVCEMQGYKGRIGLVELLEVTPELKKRIVAGASESELREVALAEKSLSTLLDDALYHIGRGDTSLEEILPFARLTETRGKDEPPSPAFGSAPAKTAALAKPASAAVPGAAGAPERVLIADDDPTIRIILRKVLEGQGYSVEEAEDGPKALAAVASSAPDMLLVDLNMPGLDGLGVIRGVRESLGLGMPIIMLTADSDDRSQAQALELGADDYIIKPVKVSLVVARVKAAFRRAGV